MLSDNVARRESLRDANLDGIPVYAECGGLMYLADSLSFDGSEYPMTGLIPARVEADAGARQMGYRQLRAVEDCLVAARGQSLRGHEYHWGPIHHRHTHPRPAYQPSHPTPHPTS